MYTEEKPENEWREMPGVIVYMHINIYVCVVGEVRRVEVR